MQQARVSSDAVLGRFWMRSISSLIASSALAVVSGSPQATSDLPDSVPQFLADAAATSVADFAQALAEARVPAGFVAFDSDFFESDFDGEAYERGRLLWHRLSLDEHELARQVPLASAVLGFRGRHRAYDIEERDGVLLIRARALRAVRLLEGVRVDRFRLDGVRLGTAFNEAQRIVDPTIPVVSGSVGSFISDPDKPPPTLAEILAQVDPVVHVDIADVTLLAALNEIAKQTPGTVWILSRNLKGNYTLAYRRPRGGMGRLHDQLR